jgi:hypothetical protein
MDASNILHAIHVPTLAIGRTGDLDFPIEDVRRTADRIGEPNLRVWGRGLESRLGLVRFPRPATAGFQCLRLHESLRRSTKAALAILRVYYSRSNRQSRGVPRPYGLGDGMDRSL